MEHCTVCGIEVNIGNSKRCDVCGGHYCTKPPVIHGSSSVLNLKGKNIFWCDTCAKKKSCSVKDCEEEMADYCWKCLKPFCIFHFQSARYCEKCYKS